MNDAAVYHPQANERGEPVLIVSPSSPTAPASWLDPTQVATAVPLGALPQLLGGVPFAPWIDVPASNAEWADVAGQSDIAEPPFDLPASTSPAAGVVIVEDDGRVWAVSPSNRFGGYETTFPKGRVDPGVNLQATAIREAFEESGLRVEILAHLVDCARTLTYTRFYLARRIGGNPALMGWESQAVSLIPQEHLRKLLCNRNDRVVIDALERSLLRKPG